MASQRKFIDVRDEVRKELDALGLLPMDPMRLRFAERRIAELLPNISQREAALKAVCYVIHALLIHEKIGELTTAQVKQYYELSLSILMGLKADERRSELAPVCGVIDSVMSQIHRKRGEHFLAAGYQILAAEAVVPGGQELFSSGYQDFCLANRYFRLGMAKSAELLYDKAIREGIPGPLSFQAHLMKSILFRLSGRHREARSVIALVKKTELNDEQDMELAWELAILNAVESQSWKELRALTRPRMRHGLKRFSAEMVLYAIVLSDGKPPKTLPNIYNLREPPGETRVGDIAFFRAASVVQSLGDHEVPRRTRIRNFLKAVEEIQQVVTIDRELLLWRASAQMARSEDMGELAEFCRGAYAKAFMGFS